jgi:hypothetical protein
MWCRSTLRPFIPRRFTLNPHTVAIGITIGSHVGIVIDLFNGTAIAADAGGRFNGGPPLSDRALY